MLSVIKLLQIFLLDVVISVICTNKSYDLSSPSSICQETTCNCTSIDHNRFSIQCDFTDSSYTVDANSLPQGSDDFEIIAAERIIFDARAFSKLPLLGRVSVKRAKSLIFKKESFVNMLSIHLRVDVEDTDSVEIEPKAFYLLKGPVTCSIIRSEHVVLHPEAVSWIQSFTLNRVQKLVMHENALSQASQKVASYHHKFNTKINFHEVSLNELPKNSFPSFANEIKISHSDIKVTRTKCFSALELYAVHFVNTTIDVLETETFSGRSLLRTLHLTNVKIGEIRPAAFLSAINNLMITDSKIDLVEHEAFNMSATGSIHFSNNLFHRVKSRGITLHAWTNATIENNRLRDLEDEAINLPQPESIDPGKTSSLSFHFTGNILKLRDRSLKFYISDDCKIEVKENIFITPCRCDWQEMLANFISTGPHVLNSMYNNSYCNVNSLLAKCINYPEGFMRALNFVENVCLVRDRIHCLQQIHQLTTNTTKSVEILNETNISSLNEHSEVLVIRILLVLSISAVLVTAFLSLCMCAQHKHRFQTECMISRMTNAMTALYFRLTSNNQLGRTISAHSITRVSVHEYAEVGPGKLSNSSSQLEEEIYVCEDKATQTLPEKRTRELLQSLREKLDDPENYKEARNVIGHLYDLIKVEECCNNNMIDDNCVYLNRDDINIGDTLLHYDIHLCPLSTNRRQIVRKKDKFKRIADKGTRTPSPEKLLLQTFPSKKQPQSSSLRQSTDIRTFMDHEHLHHTGISIGYRNKGVSISEYAEPCDFNAPIYSELEDVTTGIGENRAILFSLTSKKTSFMELDD